MDPSEVAYARNGSIHLAYQTLGTGARDLLLAQGIFSHLDHQWELPAYAAFLRRLGGFSRLVMFDPRGSGLSDRALELPPLEEQMDDVSAVLDAVDARQPVLFGVSQSGLMAILYAATYPHSRFRPCALCGLSHGPPRRDLSLGSHGGVARGVGPR